MDEKLENIYRNIEILKIDPKKFLKKILGKNSLVWDGEGMQADERAEYTGFYGSESVQCTTNVAISQKPRMYNTKRER